MKKLVIALTTLWSVNAIAQNKANDGDWKLNYVVLKGTPQADIMIRGGDIDNLSFGWEEKFDPFSGKSTPPHGYPWTPDTAFKGTDMIMLPSSMGKKDAACGGDGYSGQYESNMSQFKASVLPIHLPLQIPQDFTIQSAILQLFADDFQSPVFCSSFQVTLNGKRAPFMENALNKLNQTGPIGKLLTFEIPTEFLPLLKEKELVILIDDPQTSAADGFAIDFIKLLINPKPGAITRNSIEITVNDEATGLGIAEAIVELPNGTIYKTDKNGKLMLKDLPNGHHPLKITHCNYQDLFAGVDAEEGKKTQDPFVMSPKH